jgi:cytosine/adenosine deaminase-related metal-dependent hydrolase
VKDLAGLDIFQAQKARVQLGLGFDFYFLGEKVVKDVFRLVRLLDLKLVTSHAANLTGSNGLGLPEMMQNYDLHDDRIIISHAGGASSTDCDIINKSKKWYIASSPSVEMSLGLGVPICFQDSPVLQDSVCSLGVDCHCLSSTSMISEMRVALLAARGFDARQKLGQGTMPNKVCRTAHDAFLMGTIRGARALGMDNEIGTIDVGKRADILIFDALSPAMSPAAQFDPITAIVMHSSTGDIDTVIIDGIVRKRDGRLLPVDLTIWDQKSRQLRQTEQAVSWREVSLRVADMQSRFAKNMKLFSLEKIRPAVARLYGWNETKS